MSFLAGLAGGLLGDALGSAITGGINSAYAQKNAEYNMELQKELWKYMQSNKHQLEVQDLEAAGLNKILSATNGQAIGAPSVTGFADTSNTVNSAVVAKRQYEVAKINAETEKINAQANADNAESNRLRAEQEVAESKARIPTYLASTAKLEAEKDLVRQTISNSIKKLEYELREIDSRINLNNVQFYNISKLTDWQINKLDVEAQKLLSDIGYNEKQISLLQRELESLDPEMRRNYLENVIGEKLHYFGLAGEDISKVIGGLNFTFGRYKRSE